MINNLIDLDNAEVFETTTDSLLIITRLPSDISLDIKDMVGNIPRGYEIDFSRKKDFCFFRPSSKGEGVVIEIPVK